MNSKIARILAAMVMLFAMLPMAAHAQETLGAVDGTVTDSTGGVVQGVTVKVHSVDTGLEQTATTKSNGTFSIVDLPIGTYSITFSKQGFKTDVHPQILVRGNTTSTVNASLQAGEVSTTVTVNATPLLNDTDTTNGYTLGPEVIESTPLGTGSFTQLAILAPGLSADLLSGSGTNAGLGNQSIWANGQRDTSNGIAFNGVNATNIFNGKTSSGNGANRAILNTGEIFSLGGEIQTSTSVYDAIGQGLPTPPPETIQEMTVNAAMYDAAQGANSGAHVELVTKSGTNNYHGQLYEYHQTDAWNAAPFFRDALGSTFLQEQGQSAVPKLKRNTFGGLIGGPIKKEKLFFFASYQGQRASDQDSSFSGVFVPQGLGNFRDATTLANIANNDFGTTLTAANVGPQAQAIMCAPLTIAQCNAHMLPPGGRFLVPSEQITNDQLVQAVGFNALIQGPATTFVADQVNGNVDYLISDKDRLSGKYYYQRNPTTAPFGVSSLLGFPQQLSSGAQVASLTNTVILTPNLSWVQRAGFVRESVFAHTVDGFMPSSFGFNIFGTQNFPGIGIGTTYQDFSTFQFGGLSFGAASNFANAGTFQNQFEEASSLTWVHGRHTISTGFQWDHN
jgi:Carboxypeptidase regulatory-like domain